MRSITKNQRKWLESLAPNYMIYYNRQEGGYCPQCKVNVDFTNLPTRQGTEIVCPHCGAKAKIKISQHYYHHYTPSNDYYMGIIPAFDDSKIVLRYFGIEIEYNGFYSRKSMKIKELLREYIDNEGKMTVWDRGFDKRNWKLCSIGGSYNLDYWNNRPLGTHITLNAEQFFMYTENINRCFSKYEQLKYIDFQSLFKDAYLRDRYQALNIILKCIKNKEWNLMYEYMSKVGLNKLAMQIYENNVDLSQKSLKDILEISKESYNELVKLGDKANLDWLVYFQMKEMFSIIKTRRDYMIYIRYINTHWNNKGRKLIKIFPYSMNKLYKYIRKQKHDVSYYYDYLNMCNELKMDLKNTFVLFPKDLQKAHDMTTDIYNEMQFDIKLSDYAEKANEYSNDYDKIVEKIGNKFDFETDDYQIVVPQNTREIGIEGYKLRHCVAQYTSQIINGELFILFLRNKKELDVPFFTISIVNGTIDECKGYRNCPRPDDVQEFIDKFAKAKHLLLNKNEHFAAMI